MTVRWKLAELLARHSIKNKELGEALNIGPNAVSSLKNSPSMPRIDGDKLGDILNALNQLGNPELMDGGITLLDLLEYVGPEENIP